MRIILLIIIGMSTLNAYFVKNGSIVTDTISGLQWQDTHIGTTAEWEEAIQRCESLVIGRYTDWRLPNINELRSIIDRSKYNPAIVNGFLQISSDVYEATYWSSTAELSTTAWFVDFSDGSVYHSFRSRDYHVRCVRAGK